MKRQICNIDSEKTFGRCLPLPDKASDDLQKRIMNFLNQRHFPEAAVVEVEVDRGKVVVRGRLADKHAKWLCLELCRHVAGVNCLIDEIDVDYTANPSVPRQNPLAVAAKSPIM